MIGALERAFKAIYNEIPRPILEAAFTPMAYDVSLDERIKQEVILKRVKGDADINGGKIKTFTLNPGWLEFTQQPSPYALLPSNASAYHIPPAARDYRDITTVVDVSYPTIGTQGWYPGQSQGGRNMHNVTRAVIRSHTYTHTPLLPTVTVREGNVLMVSPPSLLSIPWQVKVRLRYDDEFVNMELSSIEPFAQCVLLATKAYIHTKLIMEIESNMVYHGMEIGSMRDIVSSYSDANKEYTELMLQFAGGEICDPDRAVNILKNMVGRI